MQQHFGIQRVCIVTDGGMISQPTIAEIEARGWLCILGGRMRRTIEARDELLLRPGRHQEVHPKSDEAKVAEEAHYDGKWMLRTNTDLSVREVALKYVQLSTVEAIFRTMKSQMDRQPILHKTDDMIRGHVLCRLPSLVMRKALKDRPVAKGHADLERPPTTCKDCRRSSRRSRARATGCAPKLRARPARSSATTAWRCRRHCARPDIHPAAAAAEPKA